MLAFGDGEFDLQGALTSGGSPVDLLKGDVMRFGWAVTSTTSTSTISYSDNIGYFDFDIRITDGSLASYFPSGDVGIFAHSGM